MTRRDRPQGGAGVKVREIYQSVITIIIIIIINYHMCVCVYTIYMYYI